MLTASLTSALLGTKVRTFVAEVELDALEQALPFFRGKIVIFQIGIVGSAVFLPN